MLKERVCTAIDDRANDIVSLAKSVQAEPELGYKETKTTEKMADRFTEMNVVPADVHAESYVRAKDISAITMQTRRSIVR